MEQYSIKEIEISILYMMQSSKEWNKAQNQYKDSAMKAKIKIPVFGKEYEADVEFHYSTIYKCLSDVSKVEINFSDKFRPLNLTPFYNVDTALADAVNEEIEDKYIGGDYES